MTSPGVETPPVTLPTVQNTTRSQCARTGVTAKYYRRNSGDVESSPLYSAWFREEIIADQRFERRRKLLSLNRSRYCYNEMEIEYSDSYWARRANSRPCLRGKRQADCKICHTQLTDWALVTSPTNHQTLPTHEVSPISRTPCYHLFHTSCYQYWRVKAHPAEDVRCPICVKSRVFTATPSTPEQGIEPPSALSPAVLQEVPLVLTNSLLSTPSERVQTEAVPTGEDQVTEVSSEKEDPDLVTDPVLES